MHDQAPDADPRHEYEKVVALRRDDVVKSIREDCDGTGDADDAERLAGEEAENATGEDGGEEDFVNAVRVVGFGEHV